jgi:peptide deformylase
MLMPSYPDPRFSEMAEPRVVDAGLTDIGERLLAAAEATRAYGLAAVHIGAVAPVVVVSIADDPAMRDYRVLYNPRIVETFGPRETGREGSVALPGVEVEISRPFGALIAFDDNEGQAQHLRLEGWPCRIAQHEIEQMNGVFFLTHLSRLKREMLLKKARKRG